METSTTIRVPWRGPAVAPGTSTSRISPIALVITILGALLIQAVLILGVVEVSLGIGMEGHPGVGPDRPPPPMPIAPAEPSLPAPVAPPERPEPAPPPGPAWHEPDGTVLVLADGVSPS